ncbi:hypothetical protein [Leucobacter luti]|uniref:hypothetical protein n=1 Tax=Leucobacter luti TaxID=340320 RepID=UPI003CFE6984
MKSRRIVLDPSLPVCWEDEDTLRIGFDSALARVRSPSAGHERMLAALRSGIQEELLEFEAERAGIDIDSARALLELLAPVMREARAGVGGGRGPAPPRPPVVAHLDDGGETVPGLAEALEALSPCVFEADRPERRGEPWRNGARAPDLVLHVERYFERLERAQRWLMAGVPHLLIRFSDRSVSVGPLVSDVRGPCLTCATLAQLEADPAYPLLAAQLAGTRAGTETVEVARVAAVTADQFILRWRAGEGEYRRQRAVLPVRDGVVSGPATLERVEPNTECACVALGDPSAAVRSASGGEIRPRSRPRPRSGKEAAVSALPRPSPTA